jgi:sterol desaturase/sphingolipid hydroxylase (fatty acid hydroxylase superfamily)
MELCMGFIEAHAAGIRLGLFAGGLLVFLLIELVIPYRPPTVSKFKRVANNLGLVVLNSVILNLLFAAPVVATAAYVNANGIGVLNHYAMPFWAKTVITILFLDLMLYIWHAINHYLPFLWRFHRVHHSDLNMDVTTASRFHIGELAISKVIQMGWIYLLGADMAGVIIFEALVVLTTQFHHSSLTIPKWFETVWWVLFVPPSMHRIHHSVVIKERNTNYGAILSLWDRVLGTMKSDLDQDRIKIGVGAYSKENQVGYLKLLYMPAEKPVR